MISEISHGDTEKVNYRRRRNNLEQNDVGDERLCVPAYVRCVSRATSLRSTEGDNPALDLQTADDVQA